MLLRLIRGNKPSVRRLTTYRHIEWSEAESRYLEWAEASVIEISPLAAIGRNGRKKGMVLSTSFASLHPWPLFSKPHKLLDSLMRGQLCLLRIIDECHSINRVNIKYVLLLMRGCIISIEQHPREP